MLHKEFAVYAGDVVAAFTRNDYIVDTDLDIFHSCYCLEISNGQRKFRVKIHATALNLCLYECFPDLLSANGTAAQFESAEQLVGICELHSEFREYLVTPDSPLVYLC